MNFEEKILKLFKNDYLRTSSLTENNIPHFYLTKLVRENKIERVARGLYIKKNDIADDFVILQSKSKYAIYSNMTALYLLGYSERIPIKYDITVISGYKGSLQGNDKVNLFYIKKDLLNIGVTNYKLSNANLIKIYDLDKTICDIIKNKNKIDNELFNKAIRQYYYSKDKNVLNLYNYAKKLRYL